jgi:hypothetical protein
LVVYRNAFVQANGEARYGDGSAVILTTKIVCVRIRVEIVCKWINTAEINTRVIGGIRCRIEIIRIWICASENYARSIVLIRGRIEIRGDRVGASENNAYGINSIAVFIYSISTDFSGVYMYV